MSKPVIVGNLSLREFFSLTEKFCAGYFDMYKSSLGRVKLVSFADGKELVYESKVYSNYKVFRKAFSQYINRQFRKL